MAKKTLTGQLTDAKARILELEGELSAALADESPQDDAQTAELVASSVRRAIAEIKAAPAPDAFAGFHTIGSVNAEGMLFLGGRAFSEQWRSEHNNPSTWVIDYTGPDSERVARVSKGPGTVEQLGPYYWRTVQPNQQYANLVLQQIRTSVLQQELDCTVVGFPKNCTRAQALEACRGRGYGAINSAVVVQAGGVSVSARKDADGKVTELLLKL